MTSEEAAELLGVQVGASSEQVGDAFRQKALDAHPDRGGSASQIALLVEARDLLISGSRSLVRRDDAVAIAVATVTAALERRPVSDAATRASGRVLRLAISPVRHARNVAATMGAIAAGLALLSTQIPAIMGDAGQGLISLTLGVVSALCGMQYLLLESKARALEECVSLLTENLADRELFHALLSDLIGPSRRWEYFTRGELADALSWRTEYEGKKGRSARRELPWPARYGGEVNPVWRVVSRVGAEEVSRLLVAKGIEMGFLEEAIEEDADSLAIRIRAVRNSTHQLKRHDA